MNSFLNRTKAIFALIIVMLTLGAFTQPAIAISKAKSSIKVETLKYNAYWHWGFIWKLAGSGSLNVYEEQLNDSTKRYHAQICGRSASIVESIMKVRDTLDSYYTPQLVPIEYTKKTHEGSYSASEHNYYYAWKNGKMLSNIFGLGRNEIDSTRVDVYRWRSKKGNDRVKVSNVGAGMDMLLIITEMRNIDYSKMKKGEKRAYFVTSGVKNRPLFLTYNGKETCTLKNGKKYPSHSITLTFGTKDSDSTPLYAWLSTDPDQRPLSIIIDLKRIGSVQGEIVE